MLKNLQLLHPKTPKDLERVQDAVDRGADTKFAIFDCLNYGNLVLMEYLLQKKISDPNEIYHHLTALQTTIKLKMGLSAIKILVENGANIQNILGYAVRYGNIKIVQYLIEKGAGLENLDENQHTPLFFAARKGKREMVHLLLESGAAVEPAGHRHRYKSPLHIAVKHGYVEIAQQLVLHGADTNKRYRRKISKIDKPHKRLETLFSEDVPDILQIPYSHRAWVIWKLQEIVPKGPHYNEMLQVLFHPVWSPEIHHLYPRKFREEIKCLLLVVRRFKWICDELLLHELITLIAKNCR